MKKFHQIDVKEKPLKSRIDSEKGKGIERNSTG
jgi:hypothetical protein